MCFTAAVAAAAAAAAAAVTSGPTTDNKGPDHMSIVLCRTAHTVVGLDSTTVVNYTPKHSGSVPFKDSSSPDAGRTWRPVFTEGGGVWLPIFNSQVQLVLCPDRHWIVLPVDRVTIHRES